MQRKEMISDLSHSHQRTILGVFKVVTSFLLKVPESQTLSSWILHTTNIHIGHYEVSHLNWNLTMWVSLTLLRTLPCHLPDFPSSDESWKLLVCWTTQPPSSHSRFAPVKSVRCGVLDIKGRAGEREVGGGGEEGARVFFLAIMKVGRGWWRESR